MIDGLDWPRIKADLDAHGCAATGPVLSPGQCDELAGLYGREERFRSRVAMERHGYGRGEYKYLAYPLPEPVASLRPALYARLAPVANRWNEAMGLARRFPAALDAFLARCRDAGQTRPTPLLLRYGPGDYNRLHQDVYGEHVFPLQAVFLLSAGFTGGDFVLTEHRPRMQSRAEVVPMARGEGVIFAVRERPAPGARGVLRVQMRHGVSRVREGERITAGIIFHDAA